MRVRYTIVDRVVGYARPGSHPYGCVRLKCAGALWMAADVPAPALGAEIPRPARAIVRTAAARNGMLLRRRGRPGSAVRDDVSLRKLLIIPEGSPRSPGLHANRRNYCSRRRNRCSLPVLVRGSTVTNSIA